MAKRKWLQKTFHFAKFLDVAITVISLFLFALGLWVFWKALRQDPTASASLSYTSTISNIILVGVTLIYASLTGFLLLETRKTRLQNAMPRLRIDSECRKTDGREIIFEVQNLGIGFATDVVVLIWELRKVSSEKFHPEPHVYIVEDAAIPAGPTPVTLRARKHEQSKHFEEWEAVLEEFERERNAQPTELLIAIKYNSLYGVPQVTYTCSRLGEIPRLPTTISPGQVPPKANME